MGAEPSFDEFFHKNCSHYFGAKFIVQSKIQIICTALFSFSDETADDLNARGGGGGPGSKWGLSRQSSGAGGAGGANRARGDSQEITYVPTSVLKGHHQGSLHVF